MEFEEEYDIVYLQSLEATSQLGFIVSYENIDKGIIRFDVEASFRSWGETFQIKLTKIDEKRTKVEMDSTSNAQLFAWFKNNDNKENFYNRLTELLKQ